MPIWPSKLPCYYTLGLMFCLHKAHKNLNTVDVFFSMRRLAIVLQARNL